jgi:hypothetical protein
MDFQFTFEQVRERVFSDDTGKWDTLLPREELLLSAGKLHLPDRDQGHSSRRRQPHLADAGAAGHPDAATPGSVF